MQNKGAIKLFTILLAITCIFYLSFTYVTRNIEKDADEYASSFVNSASFQSKVKTISAGNADITSNYIDSVYAAKRDSFLSDMRKKPVYSLGITEFTYEQCKEKEINLGLDLRGGMNVTLEVSVPDIIRGMSNNSTNATFNQAIDQAYQRQRTDNRDFVTLFGEEFKKINPNERLAPIFQTIELKGLIEYNTNDNDVLKVIRERVDESIETAEKTLRARIDKFGVTQPNIQKLASSGRILVELPGVSDKKRVRKLLQGTANLEFWETYESSEVIPMLADANTRLASLSSTDSLSSDSTKTATDSLVAAGANDTLKKNSADTTKSLASQLKKDTSLKAANDKDTTFAAFSKKNPLFAVLRPSLMQDEKGAQSYRPGPVIGYAAIKDTAKVNALFKDKQIRSIFPARMKFLWSFKPFDKEETTLELIALRVSSRDGKAPLSGDIIADARKVLDQQGGGFAQISMTMTPEAAMTWKRLTGDNIGKSIAIVLDNSVYSFPTVQGEIAGGQSQITGNFTNREADDLVNILKAGKLPAPARIVQEAVVGPTLGKEAISAGLLSFAIALLVVLAYMGFYYNKGGWVADVALFVNVFFVMGILASLGAVLTLPGIAGLVLTLGLSVDANILIFERIREELRAGKGTAQAIKEGYKGALSSILDSNITTLLLGIILYTFGTGPIQGFATTLIIGILSSLFCAIFISRIIFEGLLKKNKSIRFSVPATEHIFRNANINFVGRRKIYYAISTVILIAGIISYVQKGGFKLGIDFKGGRSYVVRFDNEKTVDDVRAVLSPVFGSAPEVKTYGSGNQQKITTTYKIDDPSEDAEAMVEAKLHEGLDKLGVKYTVMSQQKVGETVSNDIRSKAIWAILFSCLIMFIYIFIRFKKWQYGLGATVALFHDVLIVLSCYTLFDGLLPFPLEIDQHFIAAILTVMGYSMTDTVVVFDRIREYLTEKNKTDLAKGEKHTVINYALNSTLSRTMNTSAITFFVLLAIFLFGGEVIKGFSFALLIGIVIGTYSSLCIATPVVIDFDKKEKDLVPARA
jgi:SecD/SecF fusion protein